MAAALMAAVPIAAFGASADPRSAFTRFANTPAGRAAFEPASVVVSAVKPDGEQWHVAENGVDILPFDYEQGVAFTGSGLVFSSRGSLTRTTLGCPAPLDEEQPCYDVEVTDVDAIPGDLRSEGFDHIGDISIGHAGPAQGLLFAPLEKPSSRRDARGYLAYSIETLQPVARLIEDGPHGFHSWITVDPTGQFLIASDGPAPPPAETRPLRVYALSTGDGGLVIERADQFDLTLVPGNLPNFAGCAFQDPHTLYCANWVKTSLQHDVHTEIYRVDLSAAVGTIGATAVGRLVATVTLEPKGPGAVPFGMETEGVTFYRRSRGGPLELHILFRGETLGSFTYVHLRPGRG